MKSFYDLDTCRASSMSVGSIPWTAMVKYSDYYQLEPDVSEAFVDIIREMDQAFIHYQTEQQKRNKVKKSNNS